jgi:hypothetical protein
MPTLAQAPGLLWKIWRLDPFQGRGLGVHVLCKDSPAMAVLRAHPQVQDLACRLSRVDLALSAVTGAAKALDSSHLSARTGRLEAQA